jgi:hypothetical protein
MNIARAMNPEVIVFITRVSRQNYTTIMPHHARTTKIWTAVAERSGDTAFCADAGFRKRRGAALPAAVQEPWLRLSL